MTDPIKEFPIWRYRKGQVEETTDVVVVEEPLEIRLGGEPFQVLMRLPGWEKELALGFLYTEGIVRDLSEVITIHFCGTATDPTAAPQRGGRQADRGGPGPAGPAPSGGVLFQLRPVRQGGGERNLPEGAPGAERPHRRRRRRCWP